MKLVATRRKVGASIAGGLILSIALAPLPARADEAGSIDQGAALIAEIVPDVAGQTDSSAPIERSGDGAAYSTGFAEASVQEYLSVGRSAQIPREEAIGRISPDITIQPKFFTEYGHASDGIDVWRTESDSVVGYVQPLVNGVRFMTAIADTSAPDTYSYDLNLPPNSTMKANSGGFGLWAEDGSSLGQLLEPWAVDASGKHLSTTFEWDGSTLSQHVNLDDVSIVFPVVVDPAWTYSYDYTILNSTPEQVRAKLKNCFNCWFPVEGAPAQYPSSGTFLPLVVRPFWGAPVSWNFNCTFGFDGFENWGYDPNLGKVTWYVFTFLATSSHVDGAGSTITFEFNTASYHGLPASTMTVGAYIVNENPMGVGQFAYTVGANYNWTQFANKLSEIHAG